MPYCYSYIKEMPTLSPIPYCFSGKDSIQCMSTCVYTYVQTHTWGGIFSEDLNLIERELPLPLGTVISDLYELIFPLKDHSSNT